MALSKIFSNFPVLKIISGNGGLQAKAGKASETPNSNAMPKDIVELSEAAKARLGASGDITSDESKIKGLASETASLLSETGLSLGLDPEFPA